MSLPEWKKKINYLYFKGIDIGMTLSSACRHPSRHLGHIVNDHYPINAKILLVLSTFEDYQKGFQHYERDNFNGVGKRIEIDAVNLENPNYQEVIAKIKT